nr:MAG TPA: hypothetical protein [Caudoviricetes sp.]
MPDTVTLINANAFSRSNLCLNSILPKNLTMVMNQAFARSSIGSNDRKLVIPGSATNIMSYSFAYTDYDFGGSSIKTPFTTVEFGTNTEPSNLISLSNTTFIKEGDNPYITKVIIYARDLASG